MMLSKKMGVTPGLNKSTYILVVCAAKLRLADWDSQAWPKRCFQAQDFEGLNKPWETFDCHRQAGHLTECSTSLSSEKF